MSISESMSINRNQYQSFYIQIIKICFGNEQINFKIHIVYPKKILNRFENNVDSSIDISKTIWIGSFHANWTYKNLTILNYSNKIHGYVEI